MRRSKAGLTSADIGKAQQTWWGGKKYIIAAQVDLDIDRLHAHLSAREQIASKRQRKLTRLPAGSHAIWQYNAVGFCVGKLMQACIDLGMQSLRGSGGLGTGSGGLGTGWLGRAWGRSPRTLNTAHPWKHPCPLVTTEIDFVIYRVGQKYELNGTAALAIGLGDAVGVGGAGGLSMVDITAEIDGLWLYQKASKGGGLKPTHFYQMLLGDTCGTFKWIPKERYRAEAQCPRDGYTVVDLVEALVYETVEATYEDMHYLLLNLCFSVKVRSQQPLLRRYPSHHCPLALNLTPSRVRIRARGVTMCRGDGARGYGARGNTHAHRYHPLFCWQVYSTLHHDALITNNLPSTTFRALEKAVCELSAARSLMMGLMDRHLLCECGNCKMRFAMLHNASRLLRTSYLSHANNWSALAQV